MTYAVYIISAGRPAAVERMAPHLATLDGRTPVFWVTSYEDEQAYTDAGAVRVLATERHLTRQRNLALDHAFDHDLTCVQLDDDLKRFKAKTPGGARNEGGEVDLAFVLAAQATALDETGLCLAGNSPTDNLGFARDGVSTRKFVPCPCITVIPSAPRFDENLRLKEDYDFTLQHWATYGGAARCDFIAPSFGRYTNEGGAVSYRTPELEQETIAYLTEKWPGMVRPNPRRANEILLPTPRRHR